MSRFILGIDTSNYTTSAAVVSFDGELVCNLKAPLSVRDGERGLRQSDAVFGHIKNLPEIIIAAEKYIGGELAAVGVSVRPRNADGSYMPCFLAGKAAAYSAAAAAHCPVYEFSHQCGHIMAALFSAGSDVPDGRFAAFHVSGGTTELVIAEAGDEGFSVSVVGGTKDASAGQMIDRTGVLMGLSFPCGAEMERYAATYDGRIPSKKPSVDGCFFNLSGLENMAAKLFRESGDRSLVSAFVFDYIGASLEAASLALLEKYEVSRFVYAGGVMSNSIIQRRLASKINACFASPELSADNAVGIALLARRSYERGLK